MTDIVPAQAGNVPAVRQGKQQFFAEGYYGMHSDKEMGLFGMAGELSPDLRLFLLATARMNRWGHCPFRPTELLGLMGVSRPTLAKAMKGLKAAKVIAPESTVLCVVLSSQAFRRADRSDRRCSEPKHADCQERMWVHGLGWEPVPDYWRDILSHPDRRQNAAQQIQYSRTITETITISR